MDFHVVMAILFEIPFFYSPCMYNYKANRFALHCAPYCKKLELSIIYKHIYIMKPEFPSQKVIFSSKFQCTIQVVAWSKSTITGFFVFFVLFSSKYIERSHKMEEINRAEVSEFLFSMTSDL